MSWKPLPTRRMFFLQLLFPPALRSESTTCAEASQGNRTYNHVKLHVTARHYRAVFDPHQSRLQALGNGSAQPIRRRRAGQSSHQEKPQVKAAVSTMPACSKAGHKLTVIPILSTLPIVFFQRESNGLHNACGGFKVFRVLGLGKTTHSPPPARPPCPPL